MRRVIPWRILFLVALRNIARNKGRSGLSLAAIAFGVAALILSGGFVRDLTVQLGEALIHSQSGHMQLAKAGYFDVGSRSPAHYLMTAEDLRRVRAAAGDVTGISHTTRRVAFSGLLTNGDSSYPVAGEGVEPAGEVLLGTYVNVSQGRPLEPADKYGALVGAGVARALDLKVGTVLRMVAPTVDEAMNTVDLEVVGIFQSFSRDYDDRVVKMPLAAAQELMDTQGANVLVFLLGDTRDTERIAGQLTQRLSGTGLEIKTWDRLNDFYWKAVALYDQQFGVLRLIVLVMVLLAVFGALNMSVLERTGEFGTMRALGGGSADVMSLVVTEGVIMGCIGALGGAVLGVVAAAVISQAGIPMPPPPNSNLAYVAHIRVSPPLVVGAAAVGALASSLASLLPALRVSRLPVADALRRIA